MKLYILRHGEAENSAPTDSERPLTDSGRRATAQVVERRKDSMQNLNAVFASPKLRALQTADIAHRLLPSAPKPAVTDLVKPSASIASLGELLQPFANDARILLVSHQPFVGSLIDYLTDKPATGNLMGTSCLVCLDMITYSRGCATVEWVEIP